eukprot:TRINITY_DN49837_c0_g1_i1.p1 TRINITY_DN49837_c0_g1~~TRINITY_DN49837_c0_g1_i1.p1  ORF type:complete len:498 (+),score=91.81 TRINITY_DN49837_c0_g1_i1:146-1639(+)
MAWLRISISVALLASVDRVRLTFAVRPLDPLIAERLDRKPSVAAVGPGAEVALSGRPGRLLIDEQAAAGLSARVHVGAPLKPGSSLLNGATSTGASFAEDKHERIVVDRKNRKKRNTNDELKSSGKRRPDPAQLSAQAELSGTAHVVKAICCRCGYSIKKRWDTVVWSWNNKCNAECLQHYDRSSDFPLHFEAPSGCNPESIADFPIASKKMCQSKCRDVFEENWEKVHEFDFQKIPPGAREDMKPPGDADLSELLRIYADWDRKRCWEHKGVWISVGPLDKRCQGRQNGFDLKDGGWCWDKRRDTRCHNMTSEASSHGDAKTSKLEGRGETSNLKEEMDVLKSTGDAGTSKEKEEAGNNPKHETVRGQDDSAPIVESEVSGETSGTAESDQDKEATKDPIDEASEGNHVSAIVAKRIPAGRTGDEPTTSWPFVGMVIFLADVLLPGLLCIMFRALPQQRREAPPQKGADIASGIANWKTAVPPSSGFNSSEQCDSK